MAVRKANRGKDEEKMAEIAANKAAEQAQRLIIKEMTFVFAVDE